MLQLDSSLNTASSFSNLSSDSLYNAPPSPPSSSTAHSFSSSSVSSSHGGGVKKSTLILFIVLFIAAVVGGILAFQNFSQSEKTDTPQQDASLRMRPVSVAGTCSGVRVLGSEEQYPYSYTITFVLKKDDRIASLAYTFSSKIVNNLHKVDSDVTWDSLGEDGLAFKNLIRTNDRVNWNAVVNWTENGTSQQNQFSDLFVIRDETCAADASPAAVSSPDPGDYTNQQNPTSGQSHSGIAGSPTPSADVSPPATESASLRNTATPKATTLPVGGPFDTLAATASATPSPSPTATSTAKDASGDVSENTTASLPQVGTTPLTLFLLLGGFVSLILSGLFFLSRKRY